MHVGQIVEDDRGRQPERRALAREEGPLELLAMLPEQVADAVQLLQRGGPAVQAEQFPVVFQIISARFFTFACAGRVLSGCYQRREQELQMRLSLRFALVPTA